MGSKEAMTMARNVRRDLAKEAHWRDRLAQRAASGLTIAEWCRRHQISETLLHYWKGAIARRDGGPLKPKRPVGAGAPAPAAFVRVRLAPPLKTPAAAAAAVAGGGVEIVLAGSRLVRVGAGFDAPTLARVLAVLEA
jgi:hypothetical protein